MTPIRVSVVIPARDAEATLRECVRALRAQSFPAAQMEIIIVADERSTDRTLDVAHELGVRVLVHARGGAAAARNEGIDAALGRWVAFVDADCITVRGWLRALVDAAEAAGTEEQPALGAAGQIIGYESTTAAARFVDLTGGLRAERHLAHDRYPWAPTANVAYRREALAAVGGFDARFVSYEGCDLHTRLVRSVGGAFVYEPRAVVYHRHRAGWRAYWRQQVNYGRGYAQFFMRYAEELPWSIVDEARAWIRLVPLAFRGAVSQSGDQGIVRRGTFIKALAQRRGFMTTYWRRGDARKWRATPPDAQAEAAT